MKYLPTIGMEIHLHLNTKSKMFCGCANTELAPPNTNICPICTAQPGALPVINRQAVEWTALLGLAVNGAIQPEFRFERKNYFYPDLPKGYQITSANHPPIVGGDIAVGGRKIRINHIHLEEDTGSLKHDSQGLPAAAGRGQGVTLVDLNRSGAPLLELVSEADMTNGWEAKTFCQELQLIVRTLGIADADMEKGQMRCEVNISLRPDQQKEFGTKVEIKNLNSFRVVERSIDYEIERQGQLLDTGEKVTQETRGWDEKKQATVSQRTKESSHDYRYFPEPDLPPLTCDQTHYEKLQAQLPELPIAKRARFETEYGFTAEDARLLTADAPLASFTENTISELQAWLVSLETVEGNPEEIWDKNKKKLIKLLGGWLTSELFKLINEANASMAELKITPENFAEFITLVYQNKVNSTAAQKILRMMFERGSDPSDIMNQEDLAQLDDSAEIAKIITRVIAENPDNVAKYRSGKTNVLQFFVGQVMKETKGKANPEMVQKLLIKTLKH
ncbi:Asp-tRNA(Asn)/Glu-tRNA(Gln) amidotransferase subunit GatB [Candidatus Falkowbacteria bacterium]|nr:Asp-tRNA(Asn)/Glu-tRNA(Gln) amidotransferase subunit GatB [Candidatus Falkowbacteria bacterium]